MKDRHPPQEELPATEYPHRRVLSLLRSATEQSRPDLTLTDEEIARILDILGPTPTVDQLIAFKALVDVLHPTLANYEMVETLTASELRVLRMYAANLTRAEIAAVLCKQESTIKSQTRSILAKLHARNVTEALRIANRLGILTNL